MVQVPGDDQEAGCKVQSFYAEIASKAHQVIIERRHYHYIRDGVP